MPRGRKNRPRSHRESVSLPGSALDARFMPGFVGSRDRTQNSPRKYGPVRRVVVRAADHTGPVFRRVFGELLHGPSVLCSNPVESFAGVFLPAGPLGPTFVPDECENAILRESSNRRDLRCGSLYLAQLLLVRCIGMKPRCGLPAREGSSLLLAVSVLLGTPSPAPSASFASVSDSRRLVKQGNT